MMEPSEAQLDRLEAIVIQFTAGALTVHEAAEQIISIGFTDGFAIGADSPEAFESAEFQPFHDLLNEVLRLQDHRRPA
jgi:hypothetical protein